MIRKFMKSIYGKFIFVFVGIYLLSFVLALSLIVFNQSNTTENFYEENIKGLIDKSNYLYNEKNLLPDDIIYILSNNEIKLSVIDEITELELTETEMEKLKKNRYVIKIDENSKNYKKNKVAYSLGNQYINLEILEYESNFPKLILIGFFVPIVLGIISIFYAMKNILKPIELLSSTACKVSEGDFDATIEYEADNEIGALIKNFNLMIKSLKSNDYIHKDFVSNVSHEFKTPLFSIKGYLSLLKKDITREKKEEYISILDTEIERLSSLSSNLLILSELDNKVFNIKKEKINLSHIILEIVILLQNQWENKNITLDLDELHDSFVFADKNLMKQLFINLISNAIYYSNEYGQINISSKSEENKLIIYIVDNGIGISEENLIRIFEKFYKADESHNSKGTGLGLSIVKKIVDVNNMEIDIKSKIDIGTEVKLTYFNK